MVNYVVEAGWCESRDEFYADDNCRMESESFEQALESFHNIWLPDLRDEYDQFWEAFCYADNPECWKSIACEKDGETLSEFTQYERMTEEEQPRYPDIRETFAAAIR